MNKAAAVVSNFIGILVNGIKRFYTNTFFTLIIFGISCVLIHWEGIINDVEKILLRMMMVSLLGLLISTLFTLITEKLDVPVKQFKIINPVISFIVPALYFFFFLTDISNRYQVTALMGIYVAFLLVAVYYSNKTSNEAFTVHFSYLVKNMFTSAVVSLLIVMLGLFLCMTAVYFLIYKFSDLDKILFTIFSFSWIVLFVNLFFAMLPEKPEDYKIPKFFKVVTLYTALPIYLGLLLILYVYLGKIAVTRKFPSGQLNWFASFASLIGIFLFVTLKQYSDKNTFVKWYIKYFGYVLLPIIAMQCIAVHIRFQNYGLTSPRYVSMVLIGLSIVTAVVSLIQYGKHVPYVLFLGWLCSLMLTIGPLNLYNVPLNEQESRLIRVLKNNSMLKDNNEIIAKADIDKEEKIKITSAYNYIVGDDVGKSKLLNAYNGKPFKQVFGFEQEFEENDHRYNNNYTYVNYYSKTQDVDLSGYSKMLNIIPYYRPQSIIKIDNNILTINYNETEYSIDLNSFIKGVYDEYGTTDMMPQDSLMVEQNGIKLIITDISFKVNRSNGDIEINDVMGYVLFR